MAISVGQFTTVNSLTSTSGSFNISAPAGIVTNDLLLMFVISNTSSSYSSTGWTTYTSYNTYPYYTILYKIANISDVSLSSSSGSYNITTPTGTISTTASILRIVGTASPALIASKITDFAVGYDYTLSGIDYLTQKSGCLLIAFCACNDRQFAGFPNGTGTFVSSQASSNNTGFSNILFMGSGGNYSGYLYGAIAYQTVSLYASINSISAPFSSGTNGTNYKSGLQILINPFTLPKYLMRELYDANGNPYANGTPVYCASETTPTSVITGAVGSWVGNESTYLTQNVALPYGGVGFGFDAPDTDRKFIYIKPSVDEYGLISEYITPTQL